MGNASVNENVNKSQTQVCVWGGGGGAANKGRNKASELFGGIK